MIAAIKQPQNLILRDFSSIRKKSRVFISYLIFEVYKIISEKFYILSEIFGDK
jgi:hypothetical protein